MKYDLIVFIGRFQPLHNAHLEIMRRAYEQTDRLLVIRGSAGQPPTYKNPFGTLTADLISDCFFQEGLNSGKNVMIIESVVDTYDDTEWCTQVQELVNKHCANSPAKIGLIGCDKDDTSYYLKMFPQWDLIEVEQIKDLSATQIRALYFVEEPNIDFLQGVLPKTVHSKLESLIHSSWHTDIVAERKFTEKYRSQFSTLPYPPVFVTTDAVVVQSGHVLLVRRKDLPGRGLLALPGGFLDAESDKSIEEAMLRELREETGLKVPAPVLRGNIAGVHVFDAISRSTRGRTITHAYKILLPDGPLPRVKGGSDASKAFWLPLGGLRSEEFFEDHYQIIKYLT